MSALLPTNGIETRVWMEIELLDPEKDTEVVQGS